MAAYYYLASQLPYLIPGQEPPMSAAAFRELAAGFLDDEDRAQIDRCVLAAPPETPPVLPPAPGEPPALKSGFIKGWLEWERALRLNLARFRSQRLKREGAAEAPDYPADAVQAAKAASAMDSPLEAEIFIDKARWDAIERLRGLDDVGSNMVFAYLLKLLLMERRSSFKTEEGFMEYKSLYAAISGDAAGGVSAGNVRPEASR
ncbi:MAG: DUF2764 domain-containing protein [Treponema sp.]|nr:DUF2764 domain-containing protein [Treponema sp.]